MVTRRDKNNNPNPKKKPVAKKQFAPVALHADEIPDSFLDIWLQCPGFNPIMKKRDGGWYTLKAKSNKAIPLTKEQLTKAYLGQSQIIGKRPASNCTNFVSADIDRKSPYHPLVGGLHAWDVIFEAMESIGLCEFIIVQSSSSGGYHIFWPLPEPAQTWPLAKAVNTALKNYGIKPQNGHCEITPNLKSYGKDYNGLRLPLQRRDSYVVDKDLHFVSQRFDDFVLTWNQAASRQSLDLSIKYDPVMPLPHEIEFTNYGQTNDILRDLINYGDRVLGLKTVSSLAAWAKEEVQRLDGYEKYASVESKNEIENGWCDRWAACHLKQRTVYQAQERFKDMKWQDAKSLESHQRFEITLEAIKQDLESGAIQAFTSLNQARKAIIAKAKDIFGFGFGTRFLSKLKKQWAILTNPSPAPPTQAAQAEPEPAPIVNNGKVGYNLETQGSQGCTQLLSHFGTHDVQNEIEEVEIEVEQPVKLKKGDRVKIVFPGTSFDGMITKIKRQQKDELGRPCYMLDFKLGGRFHVLPSAMLEYISPIPKPALKTRDRASASVHTPTSTPIRPISTPLTQKPKPALASEPTPTAVMVEPRILKPLIKKLGLPLWLDALEGGVHRIKKEDIGRKWRVFLAAIADEKLTHHYSGG